MKPQNQDPHRLERQLGNLLRAGTILSALVVVCGGIIYLARHGQELPDYQAFRAAPPELRSVSGIVAEAVRLRGRAIIQLGLLLLIGTPIARVAFAAYGFGRQRDWLYVGISLFVLSLLLTGLLTGK